MPGFAVYTLSDPRTQAVRYVGFTRDPVKRLKFHCYDHGRPTYKGHWLKELERLALRPTLQVLCWLETIQAAWAVEMAVIAMMKRRGASLTNATAGGEGMKAWKPSPRWRAYKKAEMTRANPSSRPEVRAKVRAAWTPDKRAEFSARISARMNPLHVAKMVAASAAVRRGTHHTEESKRKMSATRLAACRHLTDEQRARMSVLSTGRRHTDEAKRRCSVANKGRHHTEEAKLKMADAARGRPMPDHCKAILLAANTGRTGWTHSAESKRRMSERRVAYWQRRKQEVR